MISAFQHGLRAPEICALRWEQAELAHGPLYVSLIRNGMPCAHPPTARRVLWHESCDEDSANHHGHPKRNARTDSRRGCFKVPDRTGPLAKGERKLASFFHWPRQAGRAFRE
jgi:hypothetical protein